MHRAWLLLLILLELFPGSLQQQIDREKRQIVFPGNEDDYGTSARTCVTPDRRPGLCIPHYSCEVQRRLSGNRLNRFICDFDGYEPRVCCPDGNRGGGGTTRTTRRPTTLPRRTTPPRRTTSPRRTTPSRRTTQTRRVTRPATRPTTRSPSVRRVASVEGVPNFLPKDCGLTASPKFRIIWGAEADKGSWPWMVVVYQEKRGSKSPDCGGALVTNQHVITAAHCVVVRRIQTLDASVLSVRLGEHDLYSNDDDMNPVDINVLSVVRHENFNYRTYENDIAVLKLVRPVTFGPAIRPICLPYAILRYTDLTQKKAFVAGWGTSFNGPSSPVLREAAFQIQNQTFCQDVYRAELVITDSYLCAGTLDGSKDSCQGDSGGPLLCVDRSNNIIRFYVMGVVSFRKLCATPGYPGVYTRITKYLDWLTPLLAP